MARLPVVGGDQSAWGPILNGYLGVELDAGGVLKNSVRNLVNDYGAPIDGTSDCTTALTNALNAGPGIVLVPCFSYAFTGSTTITVPSNVTIQGCAWGPWDTHAAPPANVPTFKVTNTSTAFLTLGALNSGIEDICFYYPNQPLPSASAPTVYPPTITDNGSVGCVSAHLRRCTIFGGYDGLAIVNNLGGLNGYAGAIHVENNEFQCLHNAMTFDQCFDTVHLRNNRLVGSGGTSTWTYNNAHALTTRRVDDFQGENNYILGWNGGHVIEPSTYTGPFSVGLGIPSGTDGDGYMNGVLYDLVAYGVYVQNTKPTIGWHYSDGHIGATTACIIAYIASGQAGSLTFDGGALWGSGAGFTNLVQAGGFAGELSFNGTRFCLVGVPSNGFFSLAGPQSVRIRDCDFQAGTTALAGSALNAGVKLIQTGCDLNGNTAFNTTGLTSPVVANNRA